MYAHFIVFCFLMKTSIVTSEMERGKKDRNGRKKGGGGLYTLGRHSTELEHSTSVTLALGFNSQPVLSGSQSVTDLDSLPPDQGNTCCAEHDQ